MSGIYMPLRLRLRASYVGVGAMAIARKGRPPSENKMDHTAVMLPRRLIRQLKTTGEASGRALSAEIRHRLEQSYDPERSPDPNTDTLLRYIGRLADEIAKDVHVARKWHEHPYALAAFKAGLDALVAQFQAERDPQARTVGDAGEQSDPPEVIGRTYARRILADPSLKREIMKAVSVTSF
jgi:hypothetical protein